MLQYCADGGTARHVAVAQLLLEQYGADVDARSLKGRTPFHVAAMRRDRKQPRDTTAFVRYLVEFGADTSLQDLKGNTALLLACRNGRLAVVEYLLRAGCDRFVVDDKGWSCLHVGGTPEGWATGRASIRDC